MPRQRLRLRRLPGPGPEVWIGPDTVEQAVRLIIPYLEDTSNTAHKAIYFDGWQGLAASAVLRAIAEHHPPSLVEKFDKIIHVDCSKWKSRRALQRLIAEELKLPQRVMDIFDKQDQEDDFRGVDESSRAEIQDAGAEINRALREHICLVFFHNGSGNTIDLNDFGIPQPLMDQWFAFGSKVLWTFRGRLRLNPGISEKVDNSHLFLYEDSLIKPWNYLLQNEAREISGYMDKLGEAVEECCLYLLSLNSQGGNIMDYDWAPHASNYWVCDGIIQGGQGDEAWEVAATLHQHLNIDDYSSNALPYFGAQLKTPPKRWIFVKDRSVVHPESTSFFLGAAASGSDPPLLPNGMFHQSDKLRVLKLCHCSFSFSSPPFHSCLNLRFLGLDSCKDQQAEEPKKQDMTTMDFFKSLWVIDICNTDWDLPSSPERIEQMSANIREVHIKNGRFWYIIFALGQLQNLRKLRVIDPTCSCETGGKDEFTVLPSLSRSTSLKTLVLDGCVGLEHVEGLPPSLESFSLHARPRKDNYKEAKISRISMAGCARLSDFTLRGSLPNLEELDLSSTRVKTLDLTTQVVQAPNLQQIILLECLQLRAIIWPEEGLPTLTVLHIDSSASPAQTKPPEVYVTIMDIGFFQSLVLQSNVRFCWKSNRYHLNLCVPCTVNVKGQSYMKDKMGPCNSGKIMGPPQPKSLTPNTYNTYIDVSIDNIIIDHDYNNGMQFQPLGSHVEIGDGISFIRTDNKRGVKAIIFVMNKAESLHAHDNSCITTTIPEHMMSIGNEKLTWRHLKSCHMVRCPKMHTAFSIINDYCNFEELVNFWAADLPMTHCIWSKERTWYLRDHISFAKLQSIHLFSCPRLTFVLPFSMLYTLGSLETLHIVFCGDLRQVFPVAPEVLTRIANYHKGVLEFPNLKHIYLHQLFKLQHICKAKMFAPKLETIRVRGCWGLKRLPAVDRDSRPIVDCEKDWWDKLEWDGPEAGHDPSLFQPRHSAYYKKPLPRVSVLR
ncbi:uncharacterized protein LOC119357314 [Triticum dicoccoides]|uniref:uncharacterized protein LOC119357314 n=1 Tax=Triticum dicoccoides TaxID=85692 RepID=UPI000E7A48BB|nr:uncharacterized protein LOC119357314 [Triticum dicoccoides]